MRKSPQSQCVFIIYSLKSCVCVLTALWHCLFCSAEVDWSSAWGSRGNPLRAAPDHRGLGGTDRQQRRGARRPSAGAGRPRAPLDIRARQRVLSPSPWQHWPLAFSHPTGWITDSEAKTGPKPTAVRGLTGWMWADRPHMNPVNSLKPTERGSVCVRLNKKSAKAAAVTVSMRLLGVLISEIVQFQYEIN